MAKRASTARGVSEDSCCGGDCDERCSCRGTGMGDCCRVEAVVSLDPRGQMVLPKEIRDAAGFGPDQKLAVVTWRRGEEICCVSLQRADDLSALVQRRYGPLLQNARPG